MKIKDKVVNMIKTVLNIQPPQPNTITIQRKKDFTTSYIENKLWYLGDGEELTQFYSQIHDDKLTFWGSSMTKGLEIIRRHTGLPSLIIDVLTSIVINSFDGITFPKNLHDNKSGENEALKDLWEKIDKDNKFKELLKEAVETTLYGGDGCFKISFDNEITDYPIIEFREGIDVEYIYKRNRIIEIIFRNRIIEKHKIYELQEIYGKGYVKYKLYKDDKEVPLHSIDSTKDLVDIKHDSSFIMAVPLMFKKSKKYEGRGVSIYDKKRASFDGFDESYSQWLQALRDNRTKTYIPEALIPKDPNNGTPLTPNSFDNRFIKTESDMREQSQNTIHTDNPTFQSDAYMQTYITSLEQSIEGIISPSTLGIDTKKITDPNADAQREKEKITLYSINTITECLTDKLEELVIIILKSYNEWIKTKDNKNNPISLDNLIVNISFKEYANPSFEAQVETVVKAKTGNIMSIDKAIDTLYGDSLSDEEKKEEVDRIKNEMGVEEMEEPAINYYNFDEDEQEV